MVFNSQKHVFWEALILTVFVFSFGILIGYLIENSRVSDIEELYTQSEFNMFDVKIQTDIISLKMADCSSAFSDISELADEVYNQARALEKYDDASRLSNSIKIEHKKYDLLRTMLWANVIQLEKSCNRSKHTIVYLYDYNEPRLDVKAEQNVFAKALAEIKAENGESVLLIPIAGDNEISSLSLMMGYFGISESELPVILIDNKVKMTEIRDKQDIQAYLE